METRQGGSGDLDRAPSRWVALLRRRAADEPEAPLYTFVRRARPRATLRVGELDLRARAIARALQRDAGGDDLALLLYPPGLDFAAALFGCFYAGVAAVPGPPPIPDRSLAHISRLAQEARVSRVLSIRAIPGELVQALASAPGLRGARWLATDDVDLRRAGDWAGGAAREGDPAVVLATPFVPGTPGLLRVSHAELFERVAGIQRAIESAPGDHSVTWLPPYLDMGLVWTVLQPLLAGVHGVSMSPLEFLREPTRWLESIHRFRARISGGPEFAYALCRAALDRSFGDADLSCWRTALVEARGPSPVLDRFARCTARLGFRAEAFEYLAARGVGAARWLGLHGRPTFGDANLVDPRTLRPPAHGEASELWLRTAAIGEGYWEGRRRPARTWPAYRGDTGEGPFLATGDEASFSGANLVLGGRAREAIRLWDGSVEPDGMESYLKGSHPSLGVDAVVAFGVGSERDERLIVAAELAPEAPAGESGAAARREGVASIQERVEEYCGARADAVLLLSPGTLDGATDPAERRARCRTRYLDGTLSSGASII